MRLTQAYLALLAAIHAGATLKVHRTLDGDKDYRLHPLDGEPVPVDRRLVEALVARGLLASNMKFPAATYLLTEEGARRAAGSAALES